MSDIPKVYDIDVPEGTVVIRFFDKDGAQIAAREVSESDALPWDEHGNGHLFQTMCAACLDEPLDVRDIDGPCPERHEEDEEA